MGCSGSKEENLPLVVRCRERRELIRAAANHRYALAAAHVSYFRSLKEVGDALRKFVDEELVTSSPSSSSFSSPSLILPPSSKNKSDNADESPFHLHDDEEDDEESHLHLSDSSSEDEDSHDYKHHHHDHHQGHDFEDDAHQHHNHHHNHARNHKGKGSEEEAGHLHHDDESPIHYPHGYNGYGNGFGGGFANDPFANPFPYPYPYPYPYSYPMPHHGYGGPFSDRWDPHLSYYSSNSNVYYMKKSAPATRTVVQNPPPEPSYGHADSFWNPQPGYGGNYGYFSTGSPVKTVNNEEVKRKSQSEAPPPPSPKASTWDFFNPFDVVENGYSGYYSSGRYGFGSNYSSPDSTEVREREGIPDLEEETESELYKEVINGGRMKGETKKRSEDGSSRSRAVPMPEYGEGSSRSVPLNRGEGSSRSIPSNKSEGSSRSIPRHKADGSSRSVPQHRGEGSSRSIPSSKSEDSSRSVHLHKVDSSSRSVLSSSGEESEKPSIPPQHYKRERSKPSMGSRYSEEGVKPSIYPPHGRGTSWADNLPNGENHSSINLSDDKSSSENVVLKSVDEGSVKKKGVTFEVEESTKQDGDSSKVSSVTILSPRGTRDLREVVAEIRDEFETASRYGKEVGVMLEVGKLPCQPGFLEVIVSRLLYLLSPSTSVLDPPTKQPAKSASSTMKSAGSYLDDAGKNVNLTAYNLSSTLDKLYVWEKKLYKEVKDEERMRVLYEKQCKRLRNLDDKGAESTKIDATRASIRRLLTRLDVSIKAIDAISSRIHKLRDEELQPQVAELIHGMTRMWKAMLKCHQKQFHAMMESKMRKLRAKTAHQPDSSSRATTELERELRAWCERFNEWIGFQKSYVESLNGWLLRCLNYEPELTADGVVPFSPGRLGAPSIFVICNDWHQAMEAISEARVANAMNTFATSLRQLWERQDEEGRQRLKAQYLSKDYEKHLRAHRMDRAKAAQEHDAASDRTGLSVIPSDSGVTPLDDPMVDLDSMRHRLAEERIKHKDAMKLVHEAASSSLQGGLVPIFKALESFTSEALKAHEHVRLQHPVQSS